MVVTTVAAKKMACPKLQLGAAEVTLRTAEMPLLAADTIFTTNASSSASVDRREMWV